MIIYITQATSRVESFANYTETREKIYKYFTPLHCYFNIFIFLSDIYGRKHISLKFALLSLGKKRKGGRKPGVN